MSKPHQQTPAEKRRIQRIQSKVHKTTSLFGEQRSYNIRIDTTGPDASGLFSAYVSNQTPISITIRKEKVAPGTEVLTFKTKDGHHEAMIGLLFQVANWVSESVARKRKEEANEHRPEVK